MLSIQLSRRASRFLVAAERPLSTSSLCLLRAVYILRRNFSSQCFHTRAHCLAGRLETRILLAQQRHYRYNTHHDKLSPQLYSNIRNRCLVSCHRRQYTSGITHSERPSDSVSKSDAANEGDEMDIYTAQTILSILDRAKQVWPSPKVPVPPGWSADWDSWDMLLSIYWTSPQYLMLPLIEMIFNIYFGTKGETRPIVYSTSELGLTNPDAEEGERDREYKAFVFTVVERPDEFYLSEFHDEPALFRILLPDPKDSQPQENQQLVESLLVELLATPDRLAFERMQPSPEGSAALHRILARDRTVIPELEHFLGYVPEHTELWEEKPQNPYPEQAAEEGESSEATAEDKQIAETSRLLKEIEARSPEFKEASHAWDKEMLDVSSLVSDDEVDPDSVESSISAIGLKEEMAELESMMDSADGEMRKLDESLQKSLDGDPASAASTFHELPGFLRVEVDEADEDHVKLSVPFKEEEGQKDSQSV
ncbi:hypothetical protein J3R30DRAFT_3430204 [Lentinula aciculospora]|uniref:Uncharacterized protein n=1 Tax=Lentinula aciculospora TaxID=153920 RepID=A0A9W9APK8_9AGAR|nr:hypothetical protein J3R30DRAFT_3430204 [Lentinula aciculospora]